MSLHVELLMPDRSLWSGEAGLVIAKTIDGDIGVLSGHSPVFGILSPGSLVRIQPEAAAEGGATQDGAAEIRAAVRDGFLSVTADRVSILTSAALLADDVDVQAAHAGEIVLLDRRPGDQATGLSPRAARRHRRAAARNPAFAERHAA